MSLEKTIQTPTHDFWSPVPSSGDVFSHEASSLFVVDEGGSGETKVTDFEITVGIQQEV